MNERQRDFYRREKYSARENGKGFNLLPVILLIISILSILYLFSAFPFDN